MDPRVARGLTAEAVAAELLLACGYHITERNFRCAAGELDLVARDRGVLVFVEVRSRSNAEHGHALQMIGASKQRRVIRVARCYLAIKSPVYDECRFDVVAITAGDPVLVKDAFRVH